VTDLTPPEAGVPSAAHRLRESLPSTPCLVRVQTAQGSSALCLWNGEQLLDLAGFRGGDFASLDRALTLPLAVVRAALEAALHGGLPEVDPHESSGLPPVESQEVWGAGVTYFRSRQARMDEALAKDVYSRVYEAERPELFFKAAGWRVVGDGGRIGVRSDSTWSVPEPELAVLGNSSAEVIGYACGNDMSSRSIEGENPLYLPQAKVYQDSCSLGPAIALAWYVDVADRAIHLGIVRDGATVYEGESSTALLTRDPAELVRVLHSSYTLPHGSWLLTGTPLVPPDSYSAAEGDVIEISIDGIGSLINHTYVVPHTGAQALPVSVTPV
jgi:2-dehydro-3-deoxy-D-arabinonate dehydratase